MYTVQFIMSTHHTCEMIISIRPRFERSTFPTSCIHSLGGGSRARPYLDSVFFKAEELSVSPGDFL